MATVSEATKLLNDYIAAGSPRAGREALFGALHGTSPDDLKQALAQSNYGGKAGREREKAQAQAVFRNDFQEHEEAATEKAKHDEQKSKDDALFEKVKDAFTPEGKIDRAQLQGTQHAAFRAVDGLSRDDVMRVLTTNGISKEVASRFNYEANSSPWAYNKPGSEAKAADDQILAAKAENTRLAEALEKAKTAGVAPAQAAPATPAPAAEPPAPATPAAAATPAPATETPAASGEPAPAAQPATVANRIDTNAIKEQVSKLAGGKAHPSQQKVATLQATLKALGADIEVDGKMGPKSREALKQLSGDTLKTLSHDDLAAVKAAAGDVGGVAFWHPNNKQVSAVAGEKVAAIKVLEQAATVSAGTERLPQQDAAAGQSQSPAATPPANAQPQQQAATR